ncbi:MAG: methyltransferase domain-containing protein [Bacteroidota bacterium]
MDFSSRSKVEEYMDDPNLDQESFRRAYLDINRCNVLLGGMSITLNAIRTLIKKHPRESYTIYDMGCGDGFMLRKIAKELENESFHVHLVGIDMRDDILSIAREASRKFPRIAYRKADILALKQVQDCDILLCTLTMHHFEEENIVEFVKKFSELAKLGTIINDLERSKLSYILFKLFSIFFIRTSIAKEDGLISISKGFLKSELKHMANNLENLQHTIKWKWAFRYLWVMEPIKSN